MPFVDMVMHGQQLNRRDAQRDQMPHRRFATQARIGASQFIGDVGMELGKPFDMQLVNHRFVQGPAGRRVVPPGKGGVDNRRQRSRRRVVALVEGEVRLRIAHLVPEELVCPMGDAADLLGVGIENDLVRVKPMSFGRLVRTMESVTINLSRPAIRQIHVPDLIGLLRQIDLP